MEQLIFLFLVVQLLIPLHGPDLMITVPRMKILVPLVLGCMRLL